MTGLTPPHRTLKRRLARWGVMGTALFAVTTSALAHHLPPGYEDVDEFAESRIVSGFLHPFTGLDHLLLALAIGWLAFAGGKRSGRMMVTSFLSSLVAGGIAGRLGFGAPMLEQGIAMSVIAGGLLLAYVARKLPHSVLVLAVLAGLWHGNAHGAEMSASAPIGYGAALLAGTALIVALGTGLAALSSTRVEPAGRWIGAGITVAGAWLWLA